MSCAVNRITIVIINVYDFQLSEEENSIDTKHVSRSGKTSVFCATVSEPGFQSNRNCASIQFRTILLLFQAMHLFVLLSMGRAVPFMFRLATTTIFHTCFIITLVCNMSMYLSTTSLCIFCHIVVHFYNNNKPNGDHNTATHSIASCLFVWVSAMCMLDWFIRMSCCPLWLGASSDGSKRDQNWLYFAVLELTLRSELLLWDARWRSNQTR